MPLKESKPSKKIRKGDRVIAIAGNYRGMQGTVLSCSGEKIVVQGLNVRKRHMKAPGKNQKGQILQIEKPIHVSNLKLCDQDGNPIKVKVRFNDNGDKELYYNKDNKDVVYRQLKKPVK